MDDLGEDLAALPMRVGDAGDVLLVCGAGHHDLDAFRRAASARCELRGRGEDWSVAHAFAVESARPGYRGGTEVGLDITSTTPGARPATLLTAAADPSVDRVW